MARDAMSERQANYLRRAHRDPVETMRLLYDLVIDGELAKDETLSPDWAELWQAARPTATERYGLPREVMQKLDEAVAATAKVDEAITEIRLHDSEAVVVLLGAGASAPEPSSIPTVNELLPELWQRSNRIDRDDLNRLQEWCESRGVRSIEDLLTAAYVANFAAKNASVTGLLDYFLFRGSRSEPTEPRGFRTSSRPAIPQVDTASIALFQDTLQTLFGLLTGRMIPAPPNAAHKALAEFVREHKRTSIVTTNYDGCIDEALIRAGIAVNTHVETAQPPISGAVDLIKMHGSINWSYCDSCQEVREFDLLGLKESYEKDTHTYPVIGICRMCAGQRRPLLVPPMAFKFIMFPNLITLWDTARQRIEEAAYVVVAGYSFSEADTYVSKIISRSMTANKRQRMIVCDPDYRLVPVLRKRFSAHIDGFDTTRVLQAAKGCEECLPGILDSLLGKASEPKKVGPRSVSEEPKSGPVPRKRPTGKAKR